MSREIKFRAWSEKYNVMFRVGGFSNMNYPLDDEYNYVTIAGPSPEGMLDATPRMTTIDLMQYTGLKDKNGVEIYEGDVVRKVPEEWPSKLDEDPRTLEQYLHDMSRVSVVEYQRDRFCLVRDEQYKDRISGGQHGSIEVIGNIYENPELLNGSDAQELKQ